MGLRGRPPAPQFPLKAEFKSRIRSCGTSIAELAVRFGWRDGGTELYRFLGPTALVPTTPRIINRLQGIAAFIDYPINRLFDRGERS
jgi:hypothetical protein